MMKFPHKDEQASGSPNKGVVFPRRPVTLALALLLVGAPPALAQEQVLEEVMVTGSRIQRTGMAMPTPVTMLNMNELLNMAPTTLIEGLDQMPQFLNNKTPAAHDIYGEASNLLNLRGIGPNRTLVLLDGRRVVSSTRSGAVDISILPEQLVQRVEVVTGGASAAYGSDAVSGVVNFILDDEFSGVKTSIQGGITDRGDNENGKLSLSFGSAVGDRGHLLLSGQYYEAKGIEGYEGRNWFDHWGTILNPNPEGPRRLIRNNVRLSSYTYGGLITSGPLAGTQFLEGGVPAPFFEGEVAGGGVQSGGSGVDPNSEYYWLVPDQERSSLFARYSHELDENLSVYLQAFAGENKSGSGSFPEPFSGPWALTIFDDNAFLPESLRQTMQAQGIESFPFERSTADLEADRYFWSRNRTVSLTAGLDGELEEGIRYSAYYQYGRNRQHQDYGSGRVLRIDRLPRAVDAVVDQASGRVVCRSTLSFPDDGCVPINMFGHGSPSQEAMDYVWGESWHYQEVEQHFAEISAQAEVFDTWAGQVSLAGGLSYREDSFHQVAGPEDLVALETPPGAELGYRGQPPVYIGPGIFNRGNPNGGEPVPIQGGFDVREAFVEALVPLATGMPLMQSLDLSLAARHAVYSGSGGVWAWKTGLDWDINGQLRLRATRSRDVRAGTLAERFDRTGSGGQVEQDPWNPDDAGYMITLVSGGNPNVNPEEADTLTLGFVYQPLWLEGLAMSVDYYDIQIDGAIDQLGTQDILNQCFAGAQRLCEQIRRSPESGRIVEVQDVFLNVNEARTKGVDIELAWRGPVEIFGGGEDLALRAFATYVDEDSLTNLGAPKLDRAGETGGGFGRDTVPHWTASASLTYNKGPWSIFLQERYIDSGKYDSTWIEGVDIEDNSVDSVFYTNLQLSYNVQAYGADNQIFFHVSNLLDTSPPRVPSASNYTGTSHTNRALFDMLGRRYSFGIRMSF